MKDKSPPAILHVIPLSVDGMSCRVTLLARIEANERRQITDQAHNEERFKLILDAMRDKEFPPQKIFFDGQFFDAFAWVKKCIRSAKIWSQ